MNNDKLFSWIGLIICGLWAGLFIVPNYSFIDWVFLAFPIVGIGTFITGLSYLYISKEGD